LSAKEIFFFTLCFHGQTFPLSFEKNKKKVINADNNIRKRERKKENNI
jgi:hypothetical protein